MIGIVEEIVSSRDRIQELRVRVEDTLRDAVNFPEMTGEARIGDKVSLNVWAVELGLGTGGVDFVTETPRPPQEAEPAGHILKLRYTPWQFPVLTASAPESPWHEKMGSFVSLDGIPVVCAELHSQIPAIAAALKWQTRNTARIVYVMTDSAALNLSLSHLVYHMRQLGMLDATVTCGQASGGDFEEVNIYSALAAARAAADADVIIVCQGPGNTGTSTALGFSGIEQGIALNAAFSLGSVPIAVARLSFADYRPRHIGLSHHTRTVLSRAALCRAYVPIPRLPEEQRQILRNAMHEQGLLGKHDFVTIDAEAGLKALTDSGIEVTTMGRSLSQERPFFLAAAAAGLLAGQLIEEKGALPEKL
jgi:hypothetical protein